MIEGITRTINIQNKIIKIQSDVIDELFLLLLQHIEAKEADELPVIKKINTAAILKDELGGLDYEYK